jgi:hypothetical protein
MGAETASQPYGLRAVIGGFTSQKLYGFVGENAAGDRDRCERGFRREFRDDRAPPVYQGVL